jgi:hypothetical protein
VSVDLGRHWSIFGQIDATRGRELGDETATLRDVAVLLDVLLAIPDQSRFEGGSAFVRPAIGGVVRFGAGP